MLTFLLLFSVLKINVHRNSLSFICIHTPRTKLIIFNITMRRAKRNNKKNEIKKKFFFLYCMYNPVWYIFNWRLTNSDCLLCVLHINRFRNIHIFISPLCYVVVLDKWSASAFNKSLKYIENWNRSTRKQINHATKVQIHANKFSHLWWMCMNEMAWSIEKKKFNFVFFSRKIERKIVEITLLNHNFQCCRTT